MEQEAEQFPKCRCGNGVRFQAVTAVLDEGFCSEECLSKAMKESLEAKQDG